MKTYVRVDTAWLDTFGFDYSKRLVAGGETICEMDEINTLLSFSQPAIKVLLTRDEAAAWISANAPRSL